MVTSPADRRDAAPLFALLALLLCALAFFGWLAAAVVHGQTQAFDEHWRAVIHTHAAPSLTAAMRGVTILGSAAFGLPLSGLLFVVLWRRQARRAAVLIVVTGGGILVLDQLLKRIFDRPRPQPFFGLARPDSWSFPSGHSLFSLAFYVLLAWLLTPRLSNPARVVAWASALALAFTIGFSRVYLGVHYPTDVMGGFAVSAAWMIAVTLGDRWGRRRPSEFAPVNPGQAT